MSKRLASTPPVASSDTHLEQVLRLILEGSANTRPDLVRVTGLSRKIVIQRVDQLIAMSLVREGPTVASTGGRPPGRLDFVADAGSVLAVSLGATGLTAAITDLSGHVLATRHRRLPLGARPDVALAAAEAVFTRLLEDRPTKARGPLRGIGVGVLGPVGPDGLTMDTTRDGGWAGFSVADWFSSKYNVPVWVDNEVNMMAAGEARERSTDGCRNMLYVKMGTGIGAGLISDGVLYRGASGVAGEIGHMTISNDRSLVCWCGNSGCLGTLASGRAITKFGIAAMRKGDSPFLEGMPPRQIRDEHIVAGALAGDEACAQIMARAGEALGLAVAGATNLINPALIVIGGRVGGKAGHLLTEPVRQSVDKRSFPLATESLQIESSQNANIAGVAGSADTVIRGLLSGEQLEAWQTAVDDPSMEPAAG
ncbi:ROK family protein [Phycicoccus sp. Soil802]|uniref:ROK family protein n=1 Tax=Phycicoccus sp. Soil802 TaxID=1736414 RepID=UPI000AFC2470|nr:ROK family protein [Phycicoccus sp. Soil802]